MTGLGYNSPLARSGEKFPVMKNIVSICVLALGIAGWAYAGHSYEKIASVHDIMEAVQGPNMEALSAMMKAGGPSSDDDWKAAKKRISLIGESTQLMLMAGRVKDEPWTKGAVKVVAGSKQAISAAEARDAEAFRAAMGGVGGGCRSCHKVYKKEKK